MANHYVRTRSFWYLSQKEKRALMAFAVLVLSAHVAFNWYYAQKQKHMVDLLNQMIENPQVEPSVLPSPDTIPRDTVSQELIAEQTKNENLTPIVRINLNNPDSLILRKQGFSKYFIRNWRQYNRKGGRVRTCSQLSQFWGFDSVLFKSSIAFFDCPPEVIADINSAKRKDLEIVKGIGPKISERIIKFRNKLGGFYSLEQILETYGLDSAVADDLIHRSGLVTPHLKLNPKTVSADSLARHPYIRFSDARKISRFVAEHPELDSIISERPIPGIDPDRWSKMARYLGLD